MTTKFLIFQNNKIAGAGSLRFLKSVFIEKLSEHILKIFVKSLTNNIRE
jgi:hypothetical protein